MKYDWNVVYTYPNCEQKVFDGLLEKNINAYLPCHTVIRQWSDRKKRMNVPLFANYVFVYVSQMERYHVLSVPGITRFICFDGRPAPIPEKQINVIRMILDGNFDVTPEPFYSVGDNVKVIRGPLAGLEGMLIQKKGAQRFYIRFNSIEQAMSIDIQTNLLEKIQPQKERQADILSHPGV